MRVDYISKLTDETKFLQDLACGGVENKGILEAICKHSRQNPYNFVDKRILNYILHNKKKCILFKVFNHVNSFYSKKSINGVKIRFIVEPPYKYISKDICINFHTNRFSSGYYKIYRNKVYKLYDAKTDRTEYWLANLDRFQVSYGSRLCRYNTCKENKNKNGTKSNIRYKQDKQKIIN